MMVVANLLGVEAVLVQLLSLNSRLLFLGLLEESPQCHLPTEDSLKAITVPSPSPAAMLIGIPAVDHLEARSEGNLFSFCLFVKN